MQAAIAALETWLRSDFVHINTQLENEYRAHGALITRRPDLEALKVTLRRGGAERIRRVAEGGELPARPVDRYVLLGMVGAHLAACRRHEIDEDTNAEVDLAPAATVASRIGGSLGVAPRYVFAHQALYNSARGGVYRTFTTLRQEAIFLELNTRAVLAYRRAASALRGVPDMGVSNPMARDLLDEARRALDDVLAANQALADALDVRAFYLHIRPYFKTYRVGDRSYRGANAGDFSAINEIDVMLGLCRMTDPVYRGVVEEKRPYVPPEDRAALDALADSPPLLDAFLAEARELPSAPLADNARRFLSICRAHGSAYAFHHHRLVKPYLVVPAGQAGEQERDLTASGPPLADVVDGLARLAYLRTARDRPGIRSARVELAELRRFVAANTAADREEGAIARSLGATPPA